MRKYSYFSFCLVCISCLLLGCKDDAVQSGASLLDHDDEIIVKADTFDLTSSLRIASNVISSPDSFLVGETETRFGTLRASFMTQLACPEGFTYPETAVFDSACLYMYYQSWIGDANSPIALDVYEIDKQVLEYSPNTPYWTNIKDSDFCSFSDTTHLLAKQRIVVAGVPTDSTYSSYYSQYIPMVRMPIDTNSCFFRRLRDQRSFPSQSEFDQLFKGLLVTSNFGSSTILNINALNLNIYYHFSYEKEGQDTIVHDIKGLFANSEVRQINTFRYLQGEDKLKQELEQHPDTSYIISPAGIYTQIQLPVGAMAREIMDSITITLPNGTPTQKRPYINLAEMRVDVLNSAKKGPDSWLQPSPSMLLIKDNEVGQLDNFFIKHTLPTDTLAVVGTLVNTTDSLGQDISYYSFDIASLLTKQMRLYLDPESSYYQQDTAHLRMTIVPIVVETGTANSTTYITSVKQSITPTATMINSAQSTQSPTRLKVVYSGF